MAATHVFGWLETLEKYFDRSYVDLDLMIGHGISSSSEKEQCRKILSNLNSIFTQISLKTQAACEKITRAEAVELTLKRNLEVAISEKSFAEKEVDHLLLEIHNSQLKLLKYMGEDVSTESIQKSLQVKLEERKHQIIGEDRLRTALAILAKENNELKKYVCALQDEVYGARMAAKYLDKELAGRIQQIQLVCQKMDIQEHDRLWNTLESEILLHRHKTVIQACRGRSDNLPADVLSNVANRIRSVSVYRTPTDGLGISVTGGLEHGVPIMISEILPSQLAHQSGKFFVGDAILSVNGIDLRDKRHHEAVQILSSQQGQVEFDLLFLQDDSTDSELLKICEDSNGYRFKLYDETKVLPSRFLFQVQQRTNLMRSKRMSNNVETKDQNDAIPDSQYDSKRIDSNQSAISDAIEYQRFVEYQSKMRQQIGLSLAGEKDDNSNKTSNSSSSACPTSTNGGSVPTTLPNQELRDVSIYKSYFWNPTRNGSSRQPEAHLLRNGSEVEKSGPQYSRNTEDFLQNPKSKSMKPSLNGTHVGYAIQQKSVNSTRASRSATLTITPSEEPGCP